MNVTLRWTGPGFFKRVIKSVNAAFGINVALLDRLAAASSSVQMTVFTPEMR